MSAAVSPAKAPTPGPNDVTITYPAGIVGGWCSIYISRGIEQVPSAFRLGVTERYPGDAAAVIAQPLDPCTVRIGSDVVVTGYADALAFSIGPGRHEGTITGRGKCCDLVDCSAAIRGMQLGGVSIQALIQQLAQSMGNKDITARILSGDASAVVPQFNIALGEMPFELIDRICKWAGLLHYEDPNGNLVLARAGTAKMASGFVQGVNVEAADASFSMLERFRVR